MCLHLIERNKGQVPIELEVTLRKLACGSCLAFIGTSLLMQSEASEPSFHQNRIIPNRILKSGISKFRKAKSLAQSPHQGKLPLHEEIMVKSKEKVKEVAEIKASTKVPGPATHMNTTMYKNLVSLPDDVKKQVVDKMQVTLASATDMYSQSKFAHWNVKGDNFYQLHLVFDHVAKVIGKQADPIAERMTQLGGIANGTARQAAAGSLLPEYPVDIVAGMDHVRALSGSLGTYCACLRHVSDEIDDLGDEPTSDFYNQLIVDAEEQLYFLESHLEAGDVQ